MTKNPKVVYVVDDDESVRRALERLLRSGGFEVKVFYSGEEFLESENLDQRACVVLDIRMPGLSGLEIQEKLASKGIQIPVITVSAFDDAETREQARNLGAVAFFRKPVDGQALIDAIHWAMGVKRDNHVPR